MDCPTCDKSFDTPHATKSHHVKAHGESIAGIEVECSACGDVFRKAPSRTDTDRHFCSTECKSDGYTKPRITLTCAHCGDSFQRKQSLVGEAEHNYCSNECKGNAYRDRVTTECENCGDVFKRQRAMANRSERNYCSRECQNSHLRGMNHPAWKGGDNVAVALRRYLSGESWKQVRRELHETRTPECRMCGRLKSKNDRRLQIHHIVPVMAGGDHSRENLMFLCHRCHRKAEEFTDAHLEYPLANIITKYDKTTPDNESQVSLSLFGD